jgi:hypothetical protein
MGNDSTAMANATPSPTIDLVLEAPACEHGRCSRVTGGFIPGTRAAEGIRSGAIAGPPFDTPQQAAASSGRTDFDRVRAFAPGRGSRSR